MILAAARDLQSIGHAAGTLRTTVRQIEHAAAELDVRPAMKLNGVLYFDGWQVEEIAEHLQRADTPPTP